METKMRETKKLGALPQYGDQYRKRLSIAVALALTAGIYTYDLAPAYAAEAEEDAVPVYDMDTIVVEAQRPAWEDILSPGAVTVVDPQKFYGEHKTLPEMLESVPGVHINYANGKGQYSTVHVRGSTSAQVNIYVDGVLMNTNGSGNVDLSTISVDNLAHIEVYRGYVPARFSGAPMGGAINIVTKRPQEAGGSVSVGASSWGGKSGNVEYTAPLGEGSLLVGINRDESDGDFKYKNFDFIGNKQYAEANDIYNADYHVLPEERRRQNNGYKNTDLLAKWQDDHWTVKAGYKQRDRYLATGSSVNDIYLDMPDSFWENEYPTLAHNADIAYWSSIARADLVDQGIVALDGSVLDQQAMQDYSDGYGLSIDCSQPGALEAIVNGLADMLSLSVDDYKSLGLDNKMERKRLVITQKDLLVGRRQTVGNLEWGWRIDYLDEEKDFKNYTMLDEDAGSGGTGNSISKQRWSNFHTKRTGMAVDGSYKLGDRHLLEFLADYAHETMRVKGSDWRAPGTTSSTMSRAILPKYQRGNWKIQLQDTITLDKAATWQLTPIFRLDSWTGDGKLKSEDDWKASYGAALKRRIDDNWTLRTSYGTYNRCPTFYELYGDGAFSRPTGLDDGRWPTPTWEHGRQWDIGAVWQGKMLKADSAVTVNYFTRTSENMTEWFRTFDGGFYTNGGDYKFRGLELEGNLRWDRVDLHMTATHILSEMTKRGSFNGIPVISPGINLGDPVNGTPEWETNVRLSYRLPGDRLTVFGEYHWVDDIPDGVTYVEAVGTTNLGLKYNIRQDMKLIAGVNDVFNRYPEQARRRIDSPEKLTNWYPMAGRTYYATLQYSF